MKGFIEKLIGRLEEEKNTTYNTYNCFEIKVDLGRGIGVEKAIEIVNELAEEYINCSTDTSSGWIPCSERLPEKYGEYLCCDKYGEYIIGYPTARVSSDDYYVETEHEIMNNCIAWQPLPLAYEEGSENNA